MVGVTLVQYYIQNMSSHFGYSNCTSSPTPYDPSVWSEGTKSV